MIKNKLKLSLAAAMMITTCSYAGTVTAPNIGQIELSGDIELKQVREKSDTETISKRTAEVNINLDAKASNGLEVHTVFTAYDDNQADAAAEKRVRIKEAYIVQPFMNGKAKVIAGLAPNNTYGTDAFDNGGEAWKVAVNVPVMPGVKVTVVSKIENEEAQDSNKGDSGATAIRIDAKVGDFMIGAKYGQAFINKGDGFVGILAAADKEKKAKVLMAYVTGEVAGFDLGFEYAQKDITFQDSPAVFTQPKKQKGYYASVSKELGAFSVGLGYVNLKDGMAGGDDFAPGMILDGNVDSSGKDLTTSAIVIPLGFAINDNLSVSATYIDADIENTGTDEDVREIDLGLEYIFNENVTLSTTYGDYDSSIAGNDQKNLEFSVAITF